MIFTELRFVVFFVAVWALFWALRERRAQKLWLLAASYGFYAAWDWRFLSLIVVSTLVDFAAGLALGAESRPRQRRAWLTASVVTNLGMLGFFKYFGFFVDSAEGLFALLGFHFSRPSLEIVLPVGISFFTFQTMSYSIDVYRRRLEPTRDLLDLALFVAFFPQLVAGPIVRARSFLPQLARARPFAEIDHRRHLALFLAGFVKKACISDNIAVVVDAYFAAPDAYGGSAAWLAVVLYAIQIYCDFSGYSDMAIATAGLLGFDLGANFEAPYLARNPREFWRRWHISLSTWLRDYLYIPLGGNRGGRWATARNVLLTMGLGGLWHGAAWRFVVWGLLHGLALIAHRAWSARRPAAPGTARLGEAAAIAATFVFTCFCWIFFRAADLSTAWAVVSAFVFLDSPGDGGFDPSWWLVPALAGAVQIASRRLPRFYAGLPAWLFAFAWGAALALALLFVPFDARPFIYFQF